jgi:hypothetical protein
VIHRLTVDELHEVSHVLQSILYEIVRVQLQYRKICARWVPRMLIDEHKQKRMGAALSFLERYQTRMMNYWIISLHETRLGCRTMYQRVSKWQFQEWHNGNSQERLVGGGEINSSRHVQLQGKERHLLSETSCPMKRPLMQTHTYCATMKWLQCAIRNR